MSHATETVHPPTSITDFSPTPNPDPVKADFIAEGKILDKAAVAATLAIVSKSVKTNYSKGQFYLHTINLISTAAGALQSQVLCDESERDLSGNAVWRDEGAPVAVAANTLVTITGQALVRQRRVKFTAGGAPAVVDSWFASI